MKVSATTTWEQAGAGQERALVLVGEAVGCGGAGEFAYVGGVAVDARGNATAVWNASDGTSYRVQAARRPAGGS